MQPNKHTIELDGVEYVVLPLNWEALEACQAGIKAIREGKGNFLEPEIREAIGELVWRSLRRATPELTLETVKRGLDMSNAAVCIETVFAAAGFKAETPKDEGGDSGDPK